jgi:hypothetical protein
VRFEVTEEFSAVRVCHCTTCKKLSGGVGTTNGRARTDAIRVVEGRDLIRTYQPGEGSAKSFCSQCGSNLFGGGWPDSELASVRISALDSPFDRKPEAHIFTRSVAAWEVLPDDGLPRHETVSG